MAYNKSKYLHLSSIISLDTLKYSPGRNLQTEAPPFSKYLIALRTIYSTYTHLRRNIHVFFEILQSPKFSLELLKLDKIRDIRIFSKFTKIR